MGKGKRTQPEPAAEPALAEKPPGAGKPLVVGKLAMRKDPRVYAREITVAVPPYRRIVGIDLGTSCGVAFCDILPGVPVVSANLVMGQWDLSLGPYDSGPLRHVRLKQFLAVLQPSLILYEEVKFSPPAAMRERGVNFILARISTAAEFLGGLKATLTTWAEERGIPAQGVPIGAIKKYATGKGNADKTAMIAAANKRFGTSFATEDYETAGGDNICDAAWICTMGVELYGEGLDGQELRDPGGLPGATVTDPAAGDPPGDCGPPV